MGQTLTNGIYLPAEGERNCYEGLAANWTALDGLIGGYNVHIGNTAIHVTAADKEAWNGKADASALTAHTGDTTIHVTAADKQTWNGHVADSVKHVTAEDKAAWNGKADASALTAHTGDTTIHVTAEDKQAWNGHVADSVKHVTAEDKATWNGKADASALTAHTGDTTIHVTAEDKTKWDAVTSKANDADVVHKAGAETIAGPKTFSDTITVPSINGINPGLLSLPDLSAGVDISGYITVGDTTQTYTPPANGWISLGCASSATHAIYVWDATNCWGTSSRSISNATYNNFTVLAIPVFAGKPITIELRVVTTLVWAKFFPCQGNV